MSIAETAELVAELNLKDQMSPGLARARGELDRLDTQVQRSGRGVSNLGKMGTEMGRHVGQGARTAGRNIEGLGFAAAAFAIGAGAAAVKWAGDFEAGMNTINTVAGLSDDALAALGESLRKTSRDSGISLAEIQAGYYDLVSAGIEAKDAQGLLNNAVTLGIGGLASTTETIDLLTTAVNAYGLDAKGAARATDMFAQAIADGKVTASEISATFADVATLAKSMGIGIDEISASYAVLTARGVPAGQAMTQMERAMKELQKPSSAVEKIMDKTGINFEKLAKQKGLVYALEELRKQADKAGVSYADLFGRQEGYAYFLATTGKAAFRAYGEELDRVNNSSGKAAEQAAERQKGMNYQLQRLRALVHDAGVTVGSELLPTLVPMFEELNKYLGSEEGQQRIKGFAKALSEGMREVAGYLRQVDFEGLSSALQAGAGFARMLMDAFLGAPPWLQQAIVTGWGLNKLTGGMLGNLFGDLLKGVTGGAKGLFGRGQSPAAPMYVQQVGAGALGAAGGGAAAGGRGLGAVGKVLGAVSIVGAALVALEGIEQFMSTVAGAQKDLAAKAEAEKDKGGAELLKDIAGLTAKLEGLGDLESLVANTWGSAELGAALKNQSTALRMLAQENKLDRGQVQTAIDSIAAAQKEAQGRGWTEVAEVLGADLEALKAKLPSAPEVGAAVAEALPKPEEQATADSEAGPARAVRVKADPRASRDIGAAVASSLRPQVQGLGRAVGSASTAQLRALGQLRQGQVLDGLVQRSQASLGSQSLRALVSLRSAMVAGDVREAAYLAALVRKPTQLTAITNVSVSTYVATRDVAYRTNIATRYGSQAV